MLDDGITEYLARCIKIEKGGRLVWKQASESDELWSTFKGTTKGQSERPFKLQGKNIFSPPHLPDSHV
jgi:hypothetical protein